VTVATPRDALVHEIATSIEAVAALAGVKVYRGFPEVELFELPAISVSASAGTIAKRRKTEIRETILGSGKIETLYETSRREMVGTIELWTKSKTTREPLELALDTLFEGGQPSNYGNDSPGSVGLVLILSTLYDVKVRALIVDKNTQDAGGARDGYFRLLYSFSASVPNVVRMEHNPATFTNTNTVSNTVEI
jgi:hypothetical protein